VSVCKGKGRDGKGRDGSLYCNGPLLAVTPRYQSAAYQNFMG